MRFLRRVHSVALWKRKCTCETCKAWMWSPFLESKGHVARSRDGHATRKIDVLGKIDEAPPAGNTHGNATQRSPEV